MFLQICLDLSHLIIGRYYRMALLRALSYRRGFALSLLHTQSRGNHYTWNREAVLCVFCTGHGGRYFGSFCLITPYLKLIHMSAIFWLSLGPETRSRRFTVSSSLAAVQSFSCVSLVTTTFYTGQKFDFHPVLTSSWKAYLISVVMLRNCNFVFDYSQLDSPRQLPCT